MGRWFSGHWPERLGSLGILSLVVTETGIAASRQRSNTSWQKPLLSCFYLLGNNEVATSAQGKLSWSVCYNFKSFQESNFIHLPTTPLWIINNMLLKGNFTPLRSTPIAMLTQSSRLVCLLLATGKSVNINCAMCFLSLHTSSPYPPLAASQPGQWDAISLTIQARCLLGHPAEPWGLIIEPSTLWACIRLCFSASLWSGDSGYLCNSQFLTRLHDLFLP